VKTVLQALSFVFLLFVAVAALFVINDPAYAQKLTGLGPEEESAPAVAQAKPAFDRKAAAAEEQRPPTREELEASMEEEKGGIPVGRYGRFVGPVSREKIGSIEAPPAALYPFTINRRTFPDATSISVEIAIKNLSGTHWETGYVTLRSPRTNDAALFQIDEWRIDEVVGLPYVFPRGELEARIRDLRVVAVSGKERQSALSRRLTDSRREVLASTETLGKRRRASGDALRAPGLLAILGGIQTPYTGVQIIEADLKPAQAQTIKLQIPEEELLPITLGVNIRQTSEERKNIAELAQKYHDIALEAQEIIGKIAGEVNGKPAGEAMAQPSLQMVPDLRNHMKELHNLGVEISRQSLRSQDTEIQRLKEVVLEHARKLNLQVLRIEAALQSVDPSFRVRENA
jgi:hypothetical protein